MSLHMCFYHSSFFLLSYLVGYETGLFGSHRAHIVSAIHRALYGSMSYLRKIVNAYLLFDAPLVNDQTFAQNV